MEMYCLVSGTFFTPVGELGMALHEMWEVSNLSMGSKPYEEYFPCVEELAQLDNDKPAIYETYRELMCYFYICLDLYPSRRNVNGLTSWVDLITCSLSWTGLLKISRLRWGTSGLFG